MLVPGTQLSSPNYPNDYPNFVSAVWTLEGSGTNHIRAIFLDFNLEYSSYSPDNCPYDWVQIFDGPDILSPLLLSACGTELPDPVESTGNVMTVWFQTDFSVVRRGFLLDWDEVPTFPTGTGCGSVLIANNTKSNVTSPGWPTGYDDNIDCAWIIEAPVGTTIMFNITAIDLEPQSSCYYDYVKVYDGYTDDTRVLGTYCGSITNYPPVYSSSNALLVVFHTDSVFNMTGFAATYQTHCGGSYNAQHGIITSPLYPSNYPANQNCTWTVTALDGYTIQVNVDNLNIVSSSGCQSDYLELRSGSSLSSPPLGNANGRYCGTNRPQTLETPSNTLRVHFQSDASRTASGFKLTFLAVQEGCGGQLVLSDADHGYDGYELTSPGYQQGNYPANVECVWIITGPATEAIQLDFMSPFSIQGGRSNKTAIRPLPEPTLLPSPEEPSCVYDFLDVRDGNSESAPRLARLCGNQVPNTIVSSNNVLFLKFRTDANGNYPGFKLKYRIAICGGTFSGTEGIISSPNFPNNYENNMDCKWYLQGPIGHYMTFTFPSFNIYPGSNNNCTVGGDFLQIYDGRNESATSLGQLCGTSSPNPIDTSDSFAYLRLKTDGSNVAGGFRVQYITSVEVCGGDLITSSGSFSSPNYPGQYAHSRVCTWLITVPQGRLITLRFTDIDLEIVAAFTYCFDYVRVYNGIESDSPLIGQYCGTNAPDIQSSGNTMKVEFRSDGSVSGRGFFATYDSQDLAVCGGIRAVAPGDSQHFIFSPNYGLGNYNNSVQCEWIIENSAYQNTSMYLTWDDSFNIEGTAGNCLNDYVEIRSGTDMTGQLIGRYCGDSKPDALSVPFRSLFIQFRSDQTETRPGFKMLYSASGCGGTASGSNGVITSPNYPEDYDHMYHCAWIILAPEGTTITLTFTDLAIENQAQCRYDRVYALNGGTMDSPQISGENAWCGSTAPQPITSASNKVMLVFQVDGSVNDRGFRLEWTTVQSGCGGNFHGNQGTISSVNFPNQYNSNAECIWTITVETGYHVILTFNQATFNIQSGDSVMMYDGDSQSAPSLGTYTGNTAPAAVTSSLNKVTVLFRSDANNQGNGFQATWTTGCGATFTNVTYGRIVSPGYPNRDYPNSFTCEYVINWNPGKTLAFRFDRQFEIEQSTNCVSDGLDIYSGTDNTGTLLGRLCGDESPDVVETQSSAYVYFHTDSSQTGDGFGLVFEEGCGGTYTGPTGIIQTPPHLETYRHGQNCTWVITVSNNRAVQLKFTDFDLEDGGGGCYYDYVEVLEGNTWGAPTLSNRLCGSSAPPIYTSIGNSLFINFVTDSSVAGEGFKAAYQEVFGPSQGCGGNLQTNTGTITSLDFDNDGSYENNLHCIWYISVEANKVIQITFNNFNIQAGQTSGNCLDYVEIRDGYGEYSPLVSQFCGSTAPPTLTLSGNQAYILFHSDAQLAASGFTLQYSSVDPPCGGTYNVSDTSQIITSQNYPNAYPADSRCSWVLSAPDDYTHVRIKVTALDLQSTTNCDNDYLELRDYPMTGIGEVLRFCGNTIPPVFDSLGHAVQVYFRSDAAIQNTGFSLQYYITDCNNNYTTDSGRLRSPGQGEHYHNNHDCDIRITTPNNTYVSLYFNLFNLELETNCNFDYLSIYNGTNATAPLISKHCGSGLPDPVFVLGNQVFIQFHTDSSATRDGFDITYSSSSSAGCGGNLTGRTGSFTSPYHPSQYANNLNCEWNIEVAPGGQPVSLEFTYINVQGQQGVCSPGDRVEVYDGQDSTARLFGNYCGETAPAVITASNNGRFMFVRFITDGITTTGNSSYTGFRAKFTS